jgi:hypothetical protein
MGDQPFSSLPHERLTARVMAGLGLFIAVVGAAVWLFGDTLPGLDARTLLGSGLAVLVVGLWQNAVQPDDEAV